MSLAKIIYDQIIELREEASHAKETDYKDGFLDACDQVIDICDTAAWEQGVTLED